MTFAMTPDGHYPGAFHAGRRKGRRGPREGLREQAQTMQAGPRGPGDGAGDGPRGRGGRRGGRGEGGGRSGRGPGGHGGGAFGGPPSGGGFFGGPDFPDGPGGRRGRRVRRGGRGGARGDVRAAILLLLAEEPMHGYQLIQQMRERSGGVWRPSPGSVYPTLSQLSDEGLVRLVSEEGGRNIAHLTEEGTAFVEEHKDDLGSPWDAVAGGVKGEAIDARAEIGALMGAVQQVVRVGTPDQVQRASTVLADARKAIYRLLAEDDPKGDDRS